MKISRSNNVSRGERGGQQRSGYFASVISRKDA
jgi:hypothetical protein